MQDEDMFFLIWLSTFELEDISFCELKINLNRQLYYISRQMYNWLEMLYNVCEDGGHDLCSKFKVTDGGIHYVHMEYKVNEKTRNQQMVSHPTNYGYNSFFWFFKTFKFLKQILRR